MVSLFLYIVYFYTAGGYFWPFLQNKYFAESVGDIAANKKQRPRAIEQGTYWSNSEFFFRQKNAPRSDW